MPGSVTLNSDLSKQEKAIKPRGLAKWFRLGHILRAIIKAAQFTISIDGGDIQKLKDGNGVHIRVGDAGDLTLPWRHIIGTDSVTVTGGTVQGHVVEDAELSIPSSGIRYVYVHMTETLTDADGFINSFAWAAGVLEAAVEVPDDDMTAGDYYIPILRFEDGVLTNQYETTSLGFRVVDDGTSTSNGRGEYWEA